MRLTEIKTLSKVAQYQPKFDPSTEIGSGTGAKAFYHPTHQNSIIKFIDGQKKESQVHFELTEFFLKHSDNPFFPKIYNTKKIPYYKHSPHMRDKIKNSNPSEPFHKVWARMNPDETYTGLIIEMEKLHPVTGRNIEHMLPHILHQLGIPEDTPGEKSEYNVTLKTLMKPNLKYRNRDDYLDHLKKILLTGFKDQQSLDNLAKVSKNDKFKEAVDALKQLSHKYEYDFHRHFGNMMFRLTSVGPQLVLIDPFWGLKNE